MAPWSWELSVQLEERAVNTYANLGLKPTLNASVAESGVIAQKCRRMRSQLRC
jgi:hypothetical protein